MRYAHIVGWGKYAPEKVLTNDDLSKLVDTSDNWIRQMTGIRERHIAGPKDSCASMAIAAALDALDVANISAAQIGLIIVATTTPDFSFPSTACLVQDALGADSAGAFDLSAACSGFVYGLSLATDAIKAHSIDYALVIGSEMMSRVVDWKDRNTCVLFGDGAGAMVLRAHRNEGGARERGVLSTHLHSDGKLYDILYVDGGPSTTGSSGFLRMEGKEVFRHAVHRLADVVDEALNANGLKGSDLDWLVPHQANRRIIDSMGRKLGLPPEKVVITIDRHANTSAASVPLALAEAVGDGRIKPGQLVLMEAMGGGITWGAALVRW
jgi:3-oxoacyl-[acyl-carrier-protein] synthase III